MTEMADWVLFLLGIYAMMSIINTIGAIWVWEQLEDHAGSEAEVAVCMVIINAILALVSLVAAAKLVERGMN